MGQLKRRISLVSGTMHKYRVEEKVLLKRVAITGLIILASQKKLVWPPIL